MSVKLFYDPERVEHFRQRGIDPRARQQPLATQARTALGAVEECARLRAEVARLKLENQRLSAEVDRLHRNDGPSKWSKREDYPPDDAAKRLELDIDK